MAASPERSAVRAAGRAARQSLLGANRRRSEAGLIGHLQSLHAVSTAGSVGAFVAHDGEPELRPIIDWLWQRGQTVVLPVLGDDDADRRMRFVPWRQGEDLVPGRYNIAVPPDPDRPSMKPDTLLVSLTAFDSQGGRMGRGGGFFDRYLATTSSQIIGVGFEAQRIDHVPVDPHDVRMPIMVSDLGVRLISRKQSEYRGNGRSIGKDGQPCE